MEGEVRVVNMVGRVELGVDDGDRKTSRVEDVCELKHGVYMALQGHREKYQSAAFSILHMSFSWILHGTLFPCSLCDTSLFNFNGKNCKSFLMYKYHQF